MSICFANSVEEPFEPPHDKPTIWLCAQRRLGSAWASAQSDQSLRCPHEERLEPKLPIERTAKALKCPRLNPFETFNVIAIKLVVILNHFPGDKTVFYGLHLRWGIKHPTRSRSRAGFTRASLVFFVALEASRLNFTIWCSLR